MRPLRPSGRFPLIVASLASVATLAWLGWRWAEPRAGAAHRPAPAGAKAVQTVTLPRAAAAEGPLEGGGSATRRPRDPGEVKGRVAEPARSDDRLVRAASAAPGGPPRPGAGGSIVAIDPETGQLGAPSPAQMRALEQAGQALAVSRTGEGLRETVLPNGTVIVDLDGRFEEHVVARVDRTGRLVQGCVHDADGVAKALRDTTAGRGLEVE